MLTFLTNMHVETFRMAKLKLLGFYFGLYYSIHLDRVYTTGTDGDHVVHHGERGDAGAALVLEESLILNDTIFSQRIYLNRTLDI